MDSKEIPLYVIFMLEDKKFAFLFHRMEQILDSPEIIPVPRSPGFIAGVANFHGKVLPVVDLREKLSIPAKRETASSAVMVMEWPHEAGALRLGVNVDSVAKVMELTPYSVGGMFPYAASVQGLWIGRDEIITVLSMERIFSMDEMLLVETAAAKAAAMEWGMP